MNETDAIILQVLAGDIEAYAEVIRLHQQDVWKVLAAMLLDTLKTEDLTQQTFILAYQHLAEFQRGRDFGRWIKGIARNVARQEMRSRLREERRLELYYHHWLALNESDPNSRHEELLGMTLKDCMQVLPPESARVVEMRYEQSLDFGRIAEALGRTVEATRQHLSRIRIALRDCIEKRIAKA